MTDTLPFRVRAPELEPALAWINAVRPMTLRHDLYGRVVLLYFWTSSSVHCRHVLEDIRHLERVFRDEPFAVVGVHTGKFKGERDPVTVAHAVARFGIQHAVCVDADKGIWEKFDIKAWPTLMVLDASGGIAAVGAGEPDVRQLEGRIRDLLEQEGASGRLARHSPLPIDVPPPLESTLSYPGGLACTDGGRLVVSDTRHHRLLVGGVVGDTFVVNLVIGAGRPGMLDGPGSIACFDQPAGLALMPDGRLLVADRGNHALRSVDLATSVVTTIAGTGRRGAAESAGAAVAEADPLKQELRSPSDLLALPDGSVLVAMAGAHQIWRLDRTRTRFAPLAGLGSERIQDGELSEACFAQPSALAFEPRSHAVYIADAQASAVRVLDVHLGTVETLTGAGLFDFGLVDGAPPVGRMQYPRGLAIHGRTLYVADTLNRRVRALDLDFRELRTVKLEGVARHLHDPLAIRATPRSLYLVDTDAHRLLRIDLATFKAFQLEVVGVEHVPDPEPLPHRPIEWERPGVGMNRLGRVEAALRGMLDLGWNLHADLRVSFSDGVSIPAGAPWRIADEPSGATISSGHGPQAPHARISAGPSGGRRRVLVEVNAQLGADGPLRPYRVRVDVQLSPAETGQRPQILVIIPNSPDDRPRLLVG